MSDDSNLQEREKKHIGADLIIPAAALIFTLYYFSTIFDSKWEAKVSALFVGIILIVLVVAFVAFSLASLRNGTADLGFQRLTEPLSFMPTRAFLFALTVAYIYLVHWGGFTLTTFVFLSSSMLLLSRGERWKFILLLSAILAVGGYFLFVYAFEVRFPKGPFELMMAQVL